MTELDEVVESSITLREGTEESEERGEETAESSDVLSPELLRGVETEGGTRV